MWNQLSWRGHNINRFGEMEHQKSPKHEIASNRIVTTRLGSFPAVERVDACFSLPTVEFEPKARVSSISDLTFRNGNARGSVIDPRAVRSIGRG
jgi:hypothetical protein